MSESIGRIDLDLGINTAGFKDELRGIGRMGGKVDKTFSKLSGTFGKFGRAAAAAFSVAAITKFAKSCIDLGSDLAEVQNVVDVTFGSMSGAVNDWAKNAMTSYGLSEKVAKEYLGQYGAMSKAFGNTEKMAYDQATAITGLVGDVASFYNMTTDEAFTKLKAIYTGETEGLKSLGVVMTQSALDQYALAHGYGKTTSAMTEQEKVALRLAFVTDKLSGASGDFARTSDGWANQVRILSLRFDALKASIGQGLINVLLPVIRLLNDLIAYLQRAADAFANFTAAIFGKGGSSSAASSMSDASADLAENTASAAGSAAKIKKSLSGFDQLNILSNPNSGGGGGGGGGGGSIITDDQSEEATEAANSAIDALDTFKSKLEEIASWTGLDKLWEGIKKGIDKIDFGAIKTNFKGILDSLRPIAESSFDGIGAIAKSVSEYVGKKIGRIISTAGKLIEVTTGSVQKFLNSQGKKISKWVRETSNKIANGFNNISFGADVIFGSFWTALETNQGKVETSISNILTAFSTVTTTVGTIFADMWASVTEGFAEWTLEHEGDITKFFDGIIKLITGLSDTVSNVVGGIFDTVLSWWNSDGKEIWDGIVECVGDIIGWVMRLWNEVLQPVIEDAIAAFNELWNETLKPLFEKILRLVSSVWDAVKLFWDNILKPFVDWFITTLGPIIKDVLKGVFRAFKEIFETMGRIAGDLIDALRGVIDFIVGVFTLDWEKAWGGIKDIFSGIWDAIWAAAEGAINLIIDSLNTLFGGIFDAIEGLIGLVKDAVSLLLYGSGNDGAGRSGTIGGPAAVPKIPSLPSDDYGAYDTDYTADNKDRHANDSRTGNKRRSSGNYAAANTPRLASGGYVAANTPRLAIIGDNKREGEIVAPESKIADAVARGFAAIMNKIQKPPADSKDRPIYITLKLGEGTFWEGFVDYHNSIVLQTGDSPLLI